MCTVFNVRSNQPYAGSNSYRESLLTVMNDIQD